MNATAPSRWRRTVNLASLAAVAVLAAAGCTATADVITYDLPAQSARYSFEAETNGVKTVWEYTSDRPTKPDTPTSQPCIADVVVKDPGSCRPEPLIFLRYDLGLDLDNTAKAGGLHPITVTGYYQDRLSKPPTVTEVRVEASVDGGKTWKPAITAQAGGQNTFTARIQHPKRGEAPGGVGLRISATDSAGDTVKQTIPKAYQLR
ncbi:MULTISPECIES: hypothetical protein [unclassified Streptomyces]|uniref:hypothetical protein n=1 Tax=unclassified Streptomyces TaxID=2593676 RepID=UPI00224F3370|nr:MULTISPECIES: hypothetical protein [unclassified Streptomyces]WSP59364.1 hypothetical protein OG306_37040 [Streptomyces sp. NBC_01241]WSU20118.1 hypothetical protein OG508_03335 [Streptomyces sp. NBC_01108]MCX4791125.1 hypothetical protein [Streptomyces sp. NBC_01221]MCX4793156.1 hypothetical protein [Streptomyces sp. NBC_01242]WSP61045.1 hypothetical protein OG466_03415 [Streptomyces sp. NBC_01240]